MTSPGELFLRFLAAVIFTVAAVLIGWYMVKVSKIRKHPQMPLYFYLETVVILTATWRWFIFYLGTLAKEDVQQIEWYVQWVNPISQSLIILLGFALVLHGIMNIRRIAVYQRTSDEIDRLQEQAETEQSSQTSDG